MRLRPEVVLATLVAIAPLTGFAQPPVPDNVPTRPEVRKALDMVANDPNLATERTVSMLRWKEREPADTEEPSWWEWANGIARWLRGFFGWIAESGRLLVWVLGALAAALLALFIVRLVRSRGMPRRATCATSIFVRRACPTT